MITLLIATLLMLTGSAVQAGPAGEGRTLVVAPGGAFVGLEEAVRAAAPGDRIEVRPGAYAVQQLVIDKPLLIEGVRAADGALPVLDGGGTPILFVRAGDVTVRGLHFRNVATSFIDDRAAVKVEEGHRCVVADNVFEDTFFAVYLAKTVGCRVEGNEMQGRTTSQTQAGNGIHLWYSRDAVIRGNTIRGHRDGIYLEFVEDSSVEDNWSEGNLRYGLHFMFSDRCAYRRNVLRDNEAGVAVMYAEGVEMTDNRFEDNWGGAAFGLLLKDITDSRITGNLFLRNTVALHVEGVNRVEVAGNRFEGNGWAVRIMANAESNTFRRNDFLGNTFDVATNSRQAYSLFEENFWDAYRGYDLDRDGYGDVPFRPVRLFSLLVADHEPALLLLRSLLVGFLDAAERLVPALTPGTLTDARPRMRRTR